MRIECERVLGLVSKLSDEIVCNVFVLEHRWMNLLLAWIAQTCSHVICNMKQWIRPRNSNDTRSHDSSKTCYIAKAYFSRHSCWCSLGQFSNLLMCVLLDQYLCFLINMLSMLLNFNAIALPARSKWDPSWFLENLFFIRSFTSTSHLIVLVI